jgi:exodeoxyribonuclease (lambda-induced)
MKIINCKQGSPEWLAARIGLITASKFRDATETLKNGNPTAKSTLYAAQVAIERISEQPCNEGYNSWQMERGQEKEPMGRMEYEVLTGNIASESGVCVSDGRIFGYSSDGMVGDDGLIEIKSIVSAIGVLEMWRDGDMSEYMHQMQGGMWITDRKWCDFIMYCPQLEPIGKQLFIKRVERDEMFIKIMVGKLWSFAATVSINESILRK